MKNSNVCSLLVDPYTYRQDWVSSCLKQVDQAGSEFAEIYDRLQVVLLTLQITRSPLYFIASSRQQGADTVEKLFGQK